MIIWTPTVLSVLYACVSYFCICTCLAQLSMFHMERRFRNTLIIIIIIIIIIIQPAGLVFYLCTSLTIKQRKCCHPSKEWLTIQLAFVVRFSEEQMMTDSKFRTQRFRETCLKNCLFVGCLTSQQQASVSQGRICSDNYACCHTEIEVAHPTFYLTQSQYTDTGPTSPRTDPITPGARQGSHWSANFEVTGMTRPRKNPSANEIRTRDLPLSRRTP